MPTYEYVCEACGHEFEKFQSIKAEPEKVCPECGKEQVRRKIGTGAGILFKGGGFYETDYRSSGYKEAAKKDSEAAKPAESKPAETKTESKPAEAPKPAAKTEPAPKPSST